MCKSLSQRVVFASALIAGLLSTLIPQTHAQEIAGSSLSPQDQIELQYAEALNRWGMPDYAEEIVKKINNPDAKYLIKVIKMQSLIALGKFDVAEKEVAREKNPKSQQAWAMKLALADGYYAWNKYDEAEKIYTDFFDTYPKAPPASLNTFYMNSAYKFGQMLLLLGKDKEALGAYKSVLKCKINKDVKRQMIAEMAELTVKLGEATKDKAKKKAYFADAEKLLEDLLWVEDLWFGKAIVMKAHIKEMQGDIEGAERIVDDMWTRLRDIDGRLRHSMTIDPSVDLMRYSPMAECRYMLGTILLKEARRLIKEGGNKDKVIMLLLGKAPGEEAPPPDKKKTASKDAKPAPKKKKKSGAYQHFLNVFIQYPSSQWAPEAGSKSEVVQTLLAKEYDIIIKAVIDDKMMAKVQEAQFREARNLYNQQQFKPAAAAYEKVLNLFPEGDETLPALGEWIRCYVELGNVVYQKVIIRYIAERFNKHEKLMEPAGNQLIRIADMFSTRGNAERKNEVYGLFFDHFDKHPKTASKMFGFGCDRLSKDDSGNAMIYFNKIITEHKTSPFYADAMAQIAAIQGRNGEKVQQIKTLTALEKELAKKEVPGQALINTKFQIATSYLNLNPKYAPNAAKMYDGIIKLITPENHPYQKTPEDKKKNKRVLEASMFYKAICYTRLTKPENKLPAYRMTAIRTLEQLIAKFPDSEFAPMAYSQIGILYTLLGNTKEATKALETLTKKYPDSPHAKNAKFLQADGLRKMGRIQEATRIFKQMFADTSGKYSDGQILAAGTELLKAKEYAIAIEAFDRILSKSQKRPYLEPALIGKGQALVELKKYKDAVKTMKEFAGKYPKSGYTLDSCQILAVAASESAIKEPDEDVRFDLFNEAIKGLKRAKKVAVSRKDTGLQTKISVQAARILVLKAIAEEEFGDKVVKAPEYKEDAIGAYQTLIMFANVDDKNIRPNLEDAMHECIPLFREVEKWEDIMNDCERYRKLFPTGKHIRDIMKWQNEAKGKMAISRATAPQPTTEASTEEKPTE